MGKEQELEHLMDDGQNNIIQFRHGAYQNNFASPISLVVRR